MPPLLQIPPCEEKSNTLSQPTSYCLIQPLLFLSPQASSCSSSSARLPEVSSSTLPGSSLHCPCCSLAWNAPSPALCMFTMYIVYMCDNLMTIFLPALWLLGSLVYHCLALGLTPNRVTWNIHRMNPWMGEEQMDEYGVPCGMCYRDSMIWKVRVPKTQWARFQEGRQETEAKAQTASQVVSKAVPRTLGELLGDSEARTDIIPYIFWKTEGWRGGERFAQQEVPLTLGSFRN